MRAGGAGPTIRGRRRRVYAAPGHVHVAMFLDQHPDTSGGMQTSVRLQRQFLEASGHQVTLVSPAQRGRQPKDEGIVELSSVPLGPGEYSLCVPGRATDRALHRAMAARPPVDVVHVQADFWQAIIGYRFAAAVNAPVVHTMHNRLDVGIAATMPFPGLVQRGFGALQRRFLDTGRPAARDAWTYLARFTERAEKGDGSVLPLRPTPAGAGGLRQRRRRFQRTRRRDRPGTAPGTKTRPPGPPAAGLGGTVQCREAAASLPRRGGPLRHRRRNPHFRRRGPTPGGRGPGRRDRPGGGRVPRQGALPPDARRTARRRCAGADLPGIRDAGHDRVRGARVGDAVAAQRPPGSPRTCRQEATGPRGTTPWRRSPPPWRGPSRNCATVPDRTSGEQAPGTSCKAAKPRRWWRSTGRRGPDMPPVNAPGPHRGRAPSGEPPPAAPVADGPVGLGALIVGPPGSAATPRGGGRPRCPERVDVDPLQTQPPVDAPAVAVTARTDPAHGSARGHDGSGRRGPAHRLEAGEQPVPVVDRQHRPVHHGPRERHGPRRRGPHGIPGGSLQVGAAVSRKPVARRGIERLQHGRRTPSPAREWPQPRTGRLCAAHDRTGPDRTGPDGTSPDRSGRGRDGGQ